MRRFRSILQFVPRYRRYILAGFGCLIMSRVLALQIPGILGRSLDEIARGVELSFGTMGRDALLLVGISAALAFFHFGMRWFLITTSRRLERDLRNKLYGHLLRLPASFYHHRPTGDLMSRSSSDVEQVRLAIGPGIMYLANTIIVVPLALVFLLRMSVPLTLLALTPLVGIALVTKVIAPRMHRHSRKVQESAADLSTRAQESFAGARVVKVFAREDHEISEFAKEAHGYLTASMGLARVRAILRPSLQALEGVGSLVLLFVGGRYIIGGALSVGDLLAFFAYQRLLVWPMIAVGWVIALFQRGRAAMERIDEILDTEPDIQDPTEPVTVPPKRGEIEVRNLTFAYDGERVLEDISFSVPAGSSLAVVGRTGSGKSSLVDLLLRTYPVPPGAVFVDRVDVNRYRLADLRGAVGYVPQETFLFSDTIAGNIAFGLEVEDRERVVAAAVKSQLAGEVEKFPEGYDTLLGERGVNLSGGQKQRTALARAIARDPAILILDDAFSSVDTQTEELILGELRQLMEGRTTILIGHRISTVRHADRILVLEAGRINESGTHEELLAAGGHYAEMERLQRLEAELEELE